MKVNFGAVYTYCAKDENIQLLHLTFTRGRCEIHTCFLCNGIWLSAVLRHLKVDKVDNVWSDGSPEDSWEGDGLVRSLSLLIENCYKRSRSLQDTQKKYLSLYDV